MFKNRLDWGSLGNSTYYFNIQPSKPKSLQLSCPLNHSGNHSAVVSEIGKSLQAAWPGDGMALAPLTIILSGAISPFLRPWSWLPLKWNRKTWICGPVWSSAQFPSQREWTILHLWHPQPTVTFRASQDAGGCMHSLNGHRRKTNPSPKDWRMGPSFPLGQLSKAPCRALTLS